MPKEPLSQGAVELLHDPLVPVDVHTTSPDLDIVFCEQLIDCAHELAPGVDLEQFWPLQRALSVDARQIFSNLFSLFCSQRLGLLLARGNVNDGECILVCLSTSRQAVMWQKEQVSLVDLVRRGDIEFWSWNLSWGREVNLPDGLLLQPAPGHIFRDLCCG